VLVHVAVVDPLDAFADGLSCLLRAGGVVAEAPADLPVWVHDEQRKVLLITLASERDWERLEHLTAADGQLLVVAMLPVLDEATCVRALTGGAVSVLPRNATPAVVLQTVDWLTRGQSVLPLPVVQQLAGAGLPQGAGPPARPRQADVPGRNADPELSADERKWLRRLAEGGTVRELATAAGYSERAMFRLLRALYDRLHVKTRTEALFLARERGWI
jgi:DNA-binding NarL/FixJ family response regulator